MSSPIINRLRQNAVNLFAKDHSVKKLADIVAELCLVCEEQEKEIQDLRDRLKALSEE